MYVCVCVCVSLLLLLLLLLLLFNHTKCKTFAQWMQEYPQQPVFMMEKCGIQSISHLDGQRSETWEKDFQKYPCLLDGFPKELLTTRTRKTITDSQRTSTSTTQTAVAKQEEQQHHLKGMADVGTANITQPQDNSKRMLTVEQKQ